MEIKKIGCSKADRIDACNGSILPNDSYKEQSGPDANAGRACHEALSYVPQHIGPPVEVIAAKYSVDQGDIDRAVRFGMGAWAEVGVYFPSPMIEASLESPIFRGTTDLVQAVIENGATKSIRILDWKTGHGTDRHPSQLKAYAHCAVERWGMPENGVVSVFEVWTTHREIETTNIDATELGEFAARFAGIRQVAEENPDALKYRAGAHCRFCPWRSSCEVRSNWYREAATSLVAVDHGQAVTRETIGRLYSKAVEVKRALYQFDKVVDAALLDGPIDLPDGKRLERVETEREKIAGAMALGVLKSGFSLTPEDAAVLIGDLPKSRLDSWAKGVAKKGKKAALMREIFKQLREAEAIRKEPYFSKKVVDA